MSNAPNKSRAYKEDDSIHLHESLEKARAIRLQVGENARAKRMQAKETANALALVEETALPRSMHNIHDVQCFANFLNRIL
jgi:hypothetical protein